MQSIGTLLPGLLMDSSLRMFLVAAGTASTLAILRVRSNSWRHTIWRAVLYSLFFLAILLDWVPAIPVPAARQVVPIEIVSSHLPEVPSLPLVAGPSVSDAGDYAGDVPSGTFMSTISWRTVIGAIYVLGVI